MRIKTIPFIFTSFFVAMLLLLPRWPGLYGNLRPETNAASLLILCAFALILLLFINPLRLFLPTRNILILIVLNIFIISFFRPDVVQSIRHGVAIMLSLLIVLFLTTLLHSISLRSSILLLMWNLTLAICLSATVHLLTVGKMTFLVHNITTRVSGLFYYANNAMMASVSILLSILALFLSKRKAITAPLLLFNITICLLLLASTDTRSAMLALVVSLFFILALIKVPLGTKIILVSLGILILISSYLFLNSDEKKERNQEKLMVRQMIWKATIGGIKERPLVGFGNKEIFFQEDYKARKITRAIHDAHNAFLMHMLTFGIPSWILFMLFLLTIVRNGFNSFKNEFHCLHAITLLWIFVSFFWGRTFLLSSNITQIMFMVSMLGIVCHPEAYKNSTQQQHYYVYRVSM